MKSRTLPSFWDTYVLLPESVKKVECVNQEEQIWSVRVTLGYRALGILDSNTVTWFWIGGHQDYERRF